MYTCRIQNMFSVNIIYYDPPNNDKKDKTDIKPNQKHKLIINTVKLGYITNSVITNTWL